MGRVRSRLLRSEEANLTQIESLIAQLSLVDALAGFPTNAHPATIELGPIAGDQVVSDGPRAVAREEASGA